LHQVAGHAGELEEPRRHHLRQRADDLVHVAARAEIPACAGDDDGFYFLWRAAEEVAQFRIRLGRERLLALGPVERDDANLPIAFPQEVLHALPSTACLFRLASSLSSPSCSRRGRPESSSTTHSSCARAISPKVFLPEEVRRIRHARLSSGSSKRS